MTGKIARFVGADASGNGVYDVSPPISGEDRVVAVHMSNGSATGAVGFYPPGASAYVAWWTGDTDTRHALADMGYTIVRTPPVSAADMVREFHATFGHPVANEPGLIPKARALRRVEWLQEELDELKDAIEAGDLVEVADALGDLKYLTEGTAIEFGIPLEDVFREIQGSNMSKLDENGQPIYADSGKILKGPNFWEPDLAPILKGAGWAP